MSTSSSPPSSRPSKSSKRNSGSSSSSSSASSSRRELSFRGYQSNASGHSKDPSIREKISDHKENTSNITTVGGRPTLNLKTPPKKPWAHHFSKVSTTTSPNPRILGERNRSCSPLRSGSPKVSTDLTPRDEKKKTQSTVDQQESFTPKGKSVTELSKRIQKFLVDQETLLGVTAPANNDVDTIAVSDGERIQASLSSPYDPYCSPFAERPQFLRLHGTISSMETSEVQHNTVMISELGGEIAHNIHVISNPLVPHAEAERQQADFIDEIEEGEIVGVNLGELPQPEEANVLLARDDESSHHFIEEEHSTESLEENSLVQRGDLGISLLMQTEELSDKDENQNLEEEAASLQEDEGAKEESHHIIEEEHSTESLKEISLVQGGDLGISLLMQTEELSDKVENQNHEEEAVSLQEDDGANEIQGTSKEKLDHLIICKISTNKAQMEDVQGVSSVEYDGISDVDLCKERSYARDLLSGVLLLFIMASVLMASGSPGLLPSSLRNNYISTGWHGSRFHQPLSVFLQNFEALWSEEQISLSVDARMSMEDAKNLYRSMKSLIDCKEQIYIRAIEGGKDVYSLMKTWTDQAIREIHLQFELTSHLMAEWWRKAKDSEFPGRAQQFEWMKEYDFSNEEWMNDEEANAEIVLNDWELLHEFDLLEANKLFRGSVSDSVWNDLQKNVTRLSDMSAVKGVLEGLMKLKGGRTEEDRMEVLQYFWEYARLSSHVEEEYLSIHTEDLETVDLSLHTENHEIIKESLYETDETDIIVEVAPEVPQSSETESEFSGNAEILEDVELNTEHFSKNTMDGEEAGHCDLSADFYFDLSDKHHFDLSEEDHLSEKLHLDLSKEDVHSDVPTAEEGCSAPSEEASTEEVMEQHLASETSDDTAILSEEVETGKEVMPIVTKNDIRNTLITRINFSAKSIVAAAIITLLTIGVTLVFWGRKFNLYNGTSVVNPPMPISGVQFLKKQQQHESITANNNALQERYKDISSNELRAEEVSTSLKVEHRGGEKVTMIEELNGKFASLLRSPEPSSRQQWNSPHHLREDEDLIRSPLPVSTSAHSPYGSFTTYTLLSKKEGQTVESKLTPVRRSSRLRNQEPTSVQRRIAISPP